VAVPVLALVAGCAGDSGAPISTARADRTTVTEVVDAPGTVTARAQATVSAPASGSVAALLVDEGQMVHAGEVIMRLRSDQAQQSLQQAEAAVRDLASSTPSSASVTVEVPAPPAPAASLPATTPGPGAQQAAEAAQAAFEAARQAAAQIPDPQTRDAALAAIAAAQEQAQAAAQAATAQTSATLAALTSALTQLQQQTAAVLEALTATAEQVSSVATDTASALSATQMAQAQAALAAAQATVAALTVRAPIDGVVSLDMTTTSGAGGLGKGGLPAGLGTTGGGLGGLAGSTGGLPSPPLGETQVSGPLSVGSPVRPGQPLASVVDTSEVTVTVDVDETEVLQVRPGVPATVLLDAVPEARYRAEVRSVATTPRTAAGGAVVYPTRLVFQGSTTVAGDPAPQPRPGMSAVVEIAAFAALGALSVPVAAVFRMGERDWVWLVRDGRAHRQQVVLGAQGVERVQVRSGLSDGDVVVVGQTGQLREGQQVE
jgi:multidrug efflux pump subunit AcrA (membrane-fusion protein)